VADPGRRFDAYQYFYAGRTGQRSLGALRDLLRSALALTRRASSRLLAAVVVAQLVAALLLAVQVLLAKASLEAIFEHARPGGDFAAVMRPLVALAVAAAAAGLLTGAQTHLQRLLGEKVQQVSWEGIFAVTTTVDLAEFESPGFFDDLQRVRVNALARPLTLVTGLVQVIGGTLAVLGLAISLLVIEPLLVPVLVLAGAPLWWLSRRAGRAEFRFAMRTTSQRRLRTYLEDALSGRDVAKEIRAFDLAGTLLARWRRSSDEYLADLDGHVRQRLRLSAAGALVTAAATAASLAVLIWLVFEGRVDLAAAGAALVAIRLLGGRIQQTFGGIGGLFESSLFMRDLEAFLRRAPGATAAGEARPLAGPLRDLRAEGVRFRYPGADRDALDDVSISIGAGEVIALVGENGSGKTTLAKLLSGLFAPTDGRVLWNGADLRELDPATVRPQIGVIFQDFVRYQLTARENVGFGRSELLDDLDRVVAAARRAGAHEHLWDLPQRYETALGKEFAGGHDLSGGQWQRVALARAFFRDAPLLILDEPTASLDARSEHEVFEHVQELARGRSVVLISHRFSTVRSADRIYVLEGGRVIEAGSHEELVTHGGRYAELFDLQASAYR
jgi:ATP-binding cassette, subfamily B, bacterial